MDWSWLQSLLGVALGGGIAAWTGRAAAQRDSRTAALAALAALESIQADMFNQNDADQRGGLLLDVRAALLRGGVPWVYVEVSHRLSRAIGRADHILRSALGDGGARGTYASKMIHPSRFHARPMILCADVVRQVMAESVERPLRGRLLSPLRSWQLRRLLKRVRRENELTQLPPRTDVLAEMIIPWEDPTQLLLWPRRRLLTLGQESALLPGEGFWPSTPNGANQPSGSGTQRPVSRDDPEEQSPS